MRIGYLQFQCSLYELTTKRRDLGMAYRSMRPVYEEIYNGLLRFTMQETENYYSIKPQPLLLSYCDQEGNPLEAQLNHMFNDIYCHISPIKIAEKTKMAEDEKHRAEELRLEQEKQEAIKIQRMKDGQKRKQTELLAFANRHMARWRQSAYLQEYLMELRNYSDTLLPEAKQRLLDYCEAAETCIKNKDVLIEEIFQIKDSRDII